MNSDTDFSLNTELAKIRSLPKGKRWEYIWEYYRLAFFLFAFSLFFIFAIGSFLVNGVINHLFPKDPFSIAFAAPGFTSNPEWLEDCLGALEYDEKHEKFQVLTSAPLSDATDDFRVNAGVWTANGQPDIFIVNETSYQHLLSIEALAKPSELWPENLQKLAENRMVDAFALDVSDTPMAEAFGVTEGTVYLCMYMDGHGFDRALDLVEYILTEQ